MNDRTFLCFAYGSNMCSARLRERTPSATPVGIASLAGHCLRWHKRSVDASGKCDVERTQAPGDIVWGVVYEIASTEKAALDLAEGVGHGYEGRVVMVSTAQGPREAYAYFATSTDPSLAPYDWYKAFVVSGAIEHGLPADYIALLEAVAARPDPDAGRARANARLLSAGH